MSNDLTFTLKVQNQTDEEMQAIEIIDTVLNGKLFTLTQDQKNRILKWAVSKNIEMQKDIM